MLITIYGAPGCGKSTIAMGLTSYLKAKGENAEYVGEYIKNLIAEHGENHIPIYNQLDLLINQNKLLRSFYDKGHYVITDGGLLNTLVYLNKSQDYQILQCKDQICALCKALNDYYSKKINILVEPCLNKNLYKESLRNMTFQESQRIHEEFSNLIRYDYVIQNFFNNGISYTELWENICK